MSRRSRRRSAWSANTSFRDRTANVFNPAALAIVATFYVVRHRPELVGRAAGDRRRWLIVLLLATGVFITDRVNKMPLVLVFLGALLPAVHRDGVRGRPAAGRRDLPRAGPARGAVLRVLHPDRSADVARQVSRPGVCGVIVAVASFAMFEGSARRTTCWPACWWATCGRPGAGVRPTRDGSG